MCVDTTTLSLASLSSFPIISFLYVHFHMHLNELASLFVFLEQSFSDHFPEQRPSIVSARPLIPHMAHTLHFFKNIGNSYATKI